MKIIVLWDTGPGSLVEVDRRFRGVFYTITHYPDVGGSTHRIVTRFINSDFIVYI
jgi:hypothetical protein